MLCMYVTKCLFCSFLINLQLWKDWLQTFGICAGCIGCLCPCYLFGKNAEFLGSGTFLGSCVTHFILWSLFNTACCLLTDGLFLGLPGCLVSCYACGYRGILRSKYNLPGIYYNHALHQVFITWFFTFSFYFPFRKNFRYFLMVIGNEQESPESKKLCRCLM
jgi:Cys-rich protein (TIGR01571 family)